MTGSGSPGCMMRGPTTAHSGAAWAYLTSRPKVARNVGPSMRSFLARAIYVVAMVLALLVALAVVGVVDGSFDVFWLPEVARAAAS